MRAEEPRSSRPASLGLPPGQLTAQCGTVRSARAASRRRAPRWVPRVRPVAMAGLVVSGTQVSYIGQDCREIPEHLGRDCGHFAKRLDLSFNLLRYVTFTGCRTGLGGCPPGNSLQMKVRCIGCRALRHAESHPEGGTASKDSSGNLFAPPVGRSGIHPPGDLREGTYFRFILFLLTDTHADK